MFCLIEVLLGIYLCEALNKHPLIGSRLCLFSLYPKGPGPTPVLFPLPQSNVVAPFSMQRTARNSERAQVESAQTALFFNNGDGLQ